MPSLTLTRTLCTNLDVPFLQQVLRKAPTRLHGNLEKRLCQTTLSEVGLAPIMFHLSLNLQHCNFCLLDYVGETNTGLTFGAECHC